MTVDNAKQLDKLASEKIGDAVSIFLRGQNWCANFQTNGKQRRQSLKTRSKKEARRRALLIEAALLKGEYRSPAKAAGLDDAISAYKAYLRTEQRAEKTIGKYALVMRRLADLAARHKARTLRQVDIRLIDAYRAERVSQGAEPKTLHNETTILRQLVNFGLSRGMIQSDPLKGLKIKKPKPKRQPCWSRAEMDHILAAAAVQHVPALTLLAETGTRVGEIKFLTWDDIDFVAGLIHIRAKEGWRPKTGDQRSVPMSDAARAVLEKLPRVSQWVVTAKSSPQFPAGGGQISERRLLEHLKRVVKRLGLRGHLHTFRHSFISHALTQGIPEAIVRLWVGHVDREVMKLYTHIADEASQAAMQRLTAAPNKPLQRQEPDHGRSRKERNHGSAQFQHNRGKRKNASHAK